MAVMAAPDDDGDGMALFVKMHNGDVERFETATSWTVIVGGGLVLHGEDATACPVAEFSEGWAAVFEAPAPKTPPAGTQTIASRRAA